MTDAESRHDDSYYPFRWKVADFFEDLFVLHRTAVVGVLALLGLGFILVGFLVLGWGQTATETETADGKTVSEVADPAEGGDGVGGTATPDTATPDTATPDTEAQAAPSSTTESTTTTSSTTTTTTTTTTLPPESPRAPASDAELTSTPDGRIVVLNPGAVTIAGGLPTDAVADEVVELTEALFPGYTVTDEQVVDESFTDSDTVTLRLSAADLFGYNSDNLNSAYLSIVDQLAASLIENDTWSVVVSGHTDDTGPSEGNQRLSERRAASAANRLTAQGVPSARVTSIGRGEEQPIAPNGSEAGRLANRRVEFELSQ